MKSTVKCLTSKYIRNKDTISEIKETKLSALPLLYSIIYFSYYYSMLWALHACKVCSFIVMFTTLHIACTCCEIELSI